MENELQKRIEVLEQQMREHYHNGVVGRQIDINDTSGTFRTVTSSTESTTRLASTPFKPVDQVFIDTSGTTKLLYFYDVPNRTWRKIGFSGGLHAGSVTSNGTVISISGWTVASNATGNYTITHNLGTSNYIVVATNRTAREIVLSDISSNTFDILLFNSSGVATDGSLSFILQLT